MRRPGRSIAALALLLPLQHASAVQYFTIEEAQAALFPQADRFISQPVCACDLDRKAVASYSGVRYRTEQQPVWRVEHQGNLAGWFVLDEVYGKHEYITYAVALDPEGTVQGLEILDYRETHGGEVREARWRAQFVGSRYPDPLKLGGDIDNISGATLSCKHLTEGVRRILAIHHGALAEATVPK